jgi:DNA polymerase-3 subunit epsilon
VRVGRQRALTSVRGTTPWRAARWCAVDLELTGLDRRHDEIVAIGAVPVNDGRIVLGEARYMLARPSRPPSPSAVLVHKLRAPDLARAPSLQEAIAAVLEVLDGCVPVFHTAAVERHFLGAALAERGLRLGPSADTEALGRWWLSRRDGRAPAGLSLAGLARQLGQPAAAEHHALGDALTTAQAFIALAGRLDAAEVQTVGSLVRAGELLTGTRRFGPS